MNEWISYSIPLSFRTAAADCFQSKWNYFCSKVRLSRFFIIYISSLRIREVVKSTMHVIVQYKILTSQAINSRVLWSTTFVLSPLTLNESSWISFHDISFLTLFCLYYRELRKSEERLTTRRRVLEVNMLLPVGRRCLVEPIRKKMNLLRRKKDFSFSAGASASRTQTQRWYSDDDR